MIDIINEARTTVSSLAHMFPIFAMNIMYDWHYVLYTHEGKGGPVHFVDKIHNSYIV